MLLSEIKNINQLILNIYRLGYEKTSFPDDEDKCDTLNTWGFVDGYNCKPNEAYVFINPKRNFPRWTILVYFSIDDPEERILRWQFQKYEGWETDWSELITIPITPDALVEFDLEQIENYMAHTIELYEIEGAL